MMVGLSLIITNTEFTCSLTKLCTHESKVVSNSCITHAVFQVGERNEFQLHCIKNVMDQLSFFPNFLPKNPFVLFPPDCIDILGP